MSIVSKEKCKRCGFIPEHTCQLDYHHIDGDHFNDVKDNIEVLCANCHAILHGSVGWNNKASLSKEETIKIIKVHYDPQTIQRTQA